MFKMIVKELGNDKKNGITDKRRDPEHHDQHADQRRS